MLQSVDVVDVVDNVAVLGPASTELRVAGKSHRRAHVLTELYDVREDTRLESGNLRPFRIWVYTAGNYRC